jgi:hypothetical protein
VKRLALALACAAAVVTGTAGATGGGIVVRADGQVGSFQIDVTTEKQVRALAGKPVSVGSVLPPAGTKPLGHTLFYHCGPGCQTAYSISRKTGKLSDFSSNSTRFVTERGSYVGARGPKAGRWEGSKPGPGCGKGRFIRIRWDSQHRFFLVVQGGTVDAITYLGPHSIFPGGFC